AGGFHTRPKPKQPACWRLPVPTFEACQCPPTGPLLDQAVAQRVGGQVGVGVEIHFLEDPRAVGADGLDADEKLLGYLRYAASHGKLAQNLEPPLLEPHVQGTVRLVIESAHEDV